MPDMGDNPGPCPVSMSNLAYVQEKALERSILNEYLGNSGDLPVTVANLENMLKDNELSGGVLTHVTLVNARRALVSLNRLMNTMGDFVV